MPYRTKGTPTTYQTLLGGAVRVGVGYKDEDPEAVIADTPKRRMAERTAARAAHTAFQNSPDNSAAAKAKDVEAYRTSAVARSAYYDSKSDDEPDVEEYLRKRDKLLGRNMGTLKKQAKALEK